MRRKLDLNLPAWISPIRVGLFIVTFIFVAIILSPSLERNRIFSFAFESALSEPENYPEALAGLQSLEAQDCRLTWQVIVYNGWMSGTLDVDPYWEDMLACTPQAIKWLLLLTPEREDIATLAAEMYPDESISWFWLGELANTGLDRSMAAFYFEQSLILNPSDGLAWCRLGRIYESQERLEDSFQAYAQCCQNGDPGSHGCFGAGRLSEKLGDIPTAIEYYQRSHHEPALERAKELEAEK